jgi:Na+/melibiose symporter-like transporter
MGMLHRRWERMSVAMRLGTASAASLILVVIALLVRGSDDWSHAYSSFWWGLSGLAVLLGVAGVVAALATTMHTRERLAVLALSLPAPIAAVWFVYVLSQLVDLMD